MDYVVQNQYGVVTVQDRTKLNEPKEIRFITPEYRELFKIPDGEQILICYSDGEKKAMTCKYLDDYHVLVGHNAFHICEFAERMKAIGAHVAPFPEKHIIWSNYDLNLEDWRDTLEENYPEMDDYGLTEMMIQANEDNFFEERMNFDIQYNSPIIAIGDIGRWNGRVVGYKLIESGNLVDCFEQTCDYTEWYVDRNGEFRCNEYHHDGSNHIYYRKFKDGISKEERDNLINDIYYQKATQEDIDRLTEKLGKTIGEVYDWDFPTEQKERVSVRDDVNR